MTPKVRLPIKNFRGEINAQVTANAKAKRSFHRALAEAKLVKSDTGSLQRIFHYQKHPLTYRVSENVVKILPNPALKSLERAGGAVSKSYSAKMDSQKGLNTAVKQRKESIPITTLRVLRNPSAAIRLARRKIKKK